MNDMFKLGALSGLNNR